MEEIGNSNANEVKARQKQMEHNPCPFIPRWSYGMNPEVPLINLTTENSTLLAYACSHIAMIYDYSLREMSPLQGHQNAVKTLSTTRNGKWLLTADFEEDCAVIVWDMKKRVPVCTLFNPHGNQGMTAANISPNAKYIVTVGNEKCQNVHFWLWTYGKDRPDASVSLTDTMSERVKEINFNDERPEEFVLTTNYHVLFLAWSGSTLSYDRPKIIKKLRRNETLNQSCYVPKIRRVFTATTNGRVLVWGDVSSEKERVVDDPNYERKKHIKTVNLQKHSITVIIENEGMLVTGNSNGRIIFYDYQLRLLYWCESCDLDSIRWISFDIETNLAASIFETTDTSDGYKYQNIGETAAAISTKPLTVNRVCISRNDKDYNLASGTINEATLNHQLPTDATLQCSPFNVRKFLACSCTGIITLIDISKRKCHFILRHPVTAVTSLDAHPKSNYVIVGDAQGTVRLYNHKEHILTTFKNTLDFQPLLEKHMASDNIAYVTCPQIHESLKAVTALKFSPKCDMLVCGLESGVIWILHYVTLEPLDGIPYKHSAAAINKIVFSKCAKYMAYADDALTVVVFRKNDTAHLNKRNMWNLIGKYHSHCLPIRDIFFAPSLESDSGVPQLFSLGEDQELVEYDLQHSGPYPTPGLKISNIVQIEHTAVPFCLARYTARNAEGFFVISNSEYKYKIFSNSTKMIHGTYRAPTFGEPVQHLQVLTDKLVDNKGYMVFATSKEIGLQLLPLDGNPYRIHGMIGHPQKITGISVSSDKRMLFTTGYNDPCALIWEIRLRSVDTMERLGGQGIEPFYCLIEGGKKGWLMNEMKDLFYYAQILHQGEVTTVARIITDTVVIEQIPNLIRAIGYYPSNKEIENIMTEVRYQDYAETGRLREEITFEEFVRLYVNHRPAFGITIKQTKEAFCTFVEEYLSDTEEPVLTREEFLDILLGGTSNESKTSSNHEAVGEPLSLQEAWTCLKLLVSSDEEMPETEQSSDTLEFAFLPSRISYKDFTMNIMGVELPDGGN